MPRRTGAEGRGAAWGVRPAWGCAGCLAEGLDAAKKSWCRRSETPGVVSPGHPAPLLFPCLGL